MRLIFALLVPWTVLLVARIPLAGEPIAIVMPVLGGLAALSALRVHLGDGRQMTRRVIGRASLALACVAGTVLPWAPLSRPAPSDPVVVVTANLLSTNNADEATRQLIATGADVLVTVETPLLALEGLAEVYPHRLSAPPQPLGGVSLWSTYPLRRLPQLDGTAEARTVVAWVEAPEPFRVVAAHLPRPWITSGGLLNSGIRRRYEANLLTQYRLIDAVADGLAATPEPVVLAGDLNVNDRGHGYQRLTDVLEDATRSAWGTATSTKLLFLPLRLRIDHLMVGGGLCAEALPRVPLAGSDHEGVSAAIGPCPSTAPAGTRAG